MNMKSAVLTLGSLVLSAVVIGNAYYQKKQFYPSVVYITKSNPSMAVMYLQALVIVLLTGELMRKIFFGQLRAAELEHLIDRSWYVVTETCLAFTIFRDDFSPKFVALFTLLLLLKCFHWLGDDRVDYMERSPVITMLFHIRVISLLFILGTLDAYFVHLAYHSMITKGASVQLVFGFEYAILLTVVVNIFIKYILHTIDLHSENPWENKAVFLLYTELAIGLVKMVLYVFFVGIMIKIHTFPLFAIRPMYLTMRTFKKALNDVIMSRRAIHNMNTLYPDATPEELETLDNVCIICREEMVTASKKLPCNHIFHTSCLRSWFQRQQTCPTCRMDVLRLPTGPQTRPGAADGLNAGAAAPPRVPPPPPPTLPPPPQPPANVPGMLPNVFPGFFPMWMPPGLPNLAAVPPAVPRSAPLSGTSVDSAANPAEASGSVLSGDPAALPTSFPTNVPPPLFPPPLLFPPFVPPPLPTRDFSGLTTEELRKMEGEEREHVEARIQCLQNIQTLLDAAVLQMQQYSHLVASLRTKASGGTSTQSVVSPHDGLMPSTSKGTSASEVRDEEGATGFIGAKDTDRSGAMRDGGDDDEDLDERERIRRRRLQKFSETQHEITDRSLTKAETKERVGETDSNGQ